MGFKHVTVASKEGQRVTKSVEEKANELVTDNERWRAKLEDAAPELAGLLIMALQEYVAHGGEPNDAVRIRVMISTKYPRRSISPVSKTEDFWFEMYGP